MSEDTPILVKTEAPLSHQAGENAARENISLETEKLAVWYMIISEI